MAADWIMEKIEAQRTAVFAGFPRSYFGEDPNASARKYLRGDNPNTELVKLLETFTRQIAEKFIYLSHGSPTHSRKNFFVLKIGARWSPGKVRNDRAIYVDVREVNGAPCVYVVRRGKDPHARRQIPLPLGDQAALDTVFDQDVGLDGGTETLRELLQEFDDFARDRAARQFPFFPSTPEPDSQPRNGGSEPARTGHAPALPKNVVLFGPPGTGKTFATTPVALAAFAEVQGHEDFEKSEREVIAACAGAIADRRFRPDNVSRDDVDRLYSRLVEEGRIQFVTFHQSYGYEEFVEGIRARVKGKGIEYYTKAGVFKEIAEAALREWYDHRRGEPPDGKSIFKATHEAIVGKPPANKEPRPNSPSMPYVLVIDEINRGNVAKIFGELITLIEDSKRAVLPEDRQANNGDQPTGVLLPLSGDTLYLPPNLYLIGTMNTADRSLIGMDMAMRRRFSFIEVLPDPGALRRRTVSEGGATLDLAEFLRELNKRIVEHDCPEHQLGHAYFIEVQSFKDLQACMLEKVIPQLRENLAGNFRVLQEILNFRGGAGDSLVDGNGVPVTDHVKNLALFGPPAAQPTMPVGLAR